MNNPPLQKPSPVTSDLRDQWHCIMTGLFVCAQSTVLTYFFYTITLSGLWFIWLIADVVILGHLVYIFIVTYARRRIPGRGRLIERHLPCTYPGDVPFGYAFWLLYGGALVGRWTWLIKWYVSAFAEYNTNAFGASLLQIVIAMSIGVLYFFLKSVTLSEDNVPSARRSYDFITSGQSAFGVTAIWLRESVNFLDALDLVSVLLVPAFRAKLSTGLDDAILAFAGVAYLGPILHLAVYACTKFHHLTVTGAVLRLVYAIFNLLTLEIPFFVLRFILWRGQLVSISGFLVKNVVCMYIDVGVLLATVSIRSGGSDTETQQSSLTDPSKPPQGGDTGRRQLPLPPTHQVA